MNTEDWQQHGACRAPEIDTDLFFPEGGDGAEGRAICAECPVSAVCLAYALKHRIFEGIWGGTSGRQRRRMASACVRTLTCSECGLPFVDPRPKGARGRPPLTCGPLCAEDRRHVWMRTANANQRGRPDDPNPEHGTRAHYNAGCRCAACTGAERAYQRRRRLSRKVNA